MSHLFINNVLAVIAGFILAIFLSFSPMAAGVFTYHYSKSLHPAYRLIAAFLVFFGGSALIFSIY